MSHDLDDLTRRLDAELAGFLSATMPELRMTHPESVLRAISAWRATWMKHERCVMHTQRCRKPFGHEGLHVYEVET